MNFDGKLLAELGGFGKVNRLAVILIQEDKSQILGIPQTDNSTGRAEAEMVKEPGTPRQVGSFRQNNSLRFGTTSSNTGINNGSCTILQNLFHQQLLWLTGRYHILELIVGAAFTKIFGVTSGPEVTTLNILKTSWKSLDLGDRRLPEIPSYFRGEIPSYFRGEIS